MKGLLLLWLAFAPQLGHSEILAAKQVITLTPIRDLQVTAKSQVVYSFLKPCQSEALGLFVHPSQKGQLLRLAVIIRQNGVQCAGMPTLETRLVSVFKLSGVKQLVKMHSSRVTGQLRLGRVASLRQVGPFGQVEGIWQRSCAKWQGYVVQHDQSGARLGLGFLESIDKGQQLNCQAGQEVRRPRFINSKNLTSLYPLNERLPLERAFHLRLAPIDRGSVSVAEGGAGITLRYRKRCNESPVGVVVGRPRSQGLMQVGMVVAHFYNRKCGTDEGKPAYFEYTSPTYPIDSSFRLVAMPPSRGFGEFNIKVPLQFGFRGPELQAKVLGSCQRDVGVVYGGGYKDQLMIGILEKVPSKTECKKPTKQLFFKQPYFLSSSDRMSHYPMKVEGATIY